MRPSSPSDAPRSRRDRRSAAASSATTRVPASKRHEDQLEEAAPGVLGVGEAGEGERVAAAEQVGELEEHEHREQQVHDEEDGRGLHRAEADGARRDGRGSRRPGHGRRGAAAPGRCRRGRGSARRRERGARGGHGRPGTGNGRGLRGRARQRANERRQQAGAEGQEPGGAPRHDPDDDATAREVRDVDVGLPREQVPREPVEHRVGGREQGAEHEHDRQGDEEAAGDRGGATEAGQPPGPGRGCRLRVRGLPAGEEPGGPGTGRGDEAERVVEDQGHQARA